MGLVSVWGREEYVLVWLELLARTRGASWLYCGKRCSSLGGGGGGNSCGGGNGCGSGNEQLNGALLFLLEVNMIAGAVYCARAGCCLCRQPVKLPRVPQDERADGPGPEEHLMQ